MGLCETESKIIEVGSSEVIRFGPDTDRIVVVRRREEDFASEHRQQREDDEKAKERACRRNPAT
jgi:hypothetical protein